MGPRCRDYKHRAYVHSPRTTTKDHTCILPPGWELGRILSIQLDRALWMILCSNNPYIGLSMYSHIMYRTRTINIKITRDDTDIYWGWDPCPDAKGMFVELPTQGYPIQAKWPLIWSQLCTPPPPPHCRPTTYIRPNRSLLNASYLFIDYQFVFVGAVFVALRSKETDPISWF